jgi:uncharacterized protein (DUF1778 family)
MATKRIATATRLRKTRAGAEPARGRVHLRLSHETKTLLEEAAAVSTGGDLTAFMIAAATERAHRVLSDLEVTRISEPSRRRFYELMLNPPEPSDALKRLLAVDHFER